MFELRSLSSSPKKECVSASGNNWLTHNTGLGMFPATSRSFELLGFTKASELERTVFGGGVLLEVQIRRNGAPTDWETYLKKQHEAGTNMNKYHHLDFFQHKKQFFDISGFKCFATSHPYPIFPSVFVGGRCFALELKWTLPCTTGAQPRNRALDLKVELLQADDQLPSGRQMPKNGNHPPKPPVQDWDTLLKFTSNGCWKLFV